MTEDAAGLRILCVCIGNVCRSPIMERLLRLHLPDAEVRGAGVRAVVGSPMDEYAATELDRLGGNADGFTASQFQATDGSWADLVLTATSEIRSRVLEDSPGALRRTFTVRELARLLDQAPEDTAPSDLITWAARNRSLLAGEDLDVADPIGRSAEVHRDVADQIDESVRAIASALAQP